MKRNIDFTFLVIVIILVAIGILMVFSSSFYYALNRFNNLTKFFDSNLLYGILGFIALYITSKINYRIYKKPSFLILFVSYAFLVAVLLMGMEINGAKRWLSIGRFTFMPSELAKLAVVIYMAAQLSDPKNNIRRLDTLVKLVLIVGVGAGLIVMQPKFTTAGIIFLVAFGMMFLAGMRWSHIIVTFFGALAGGWVIVVSKGYSLSRITSFLNPTKDVLGSNWQQMQSLFALGSGGLFGVGLGQSTQNKLYIPEPQNDFIFATIGEEFGFIGTTFIVMLFAILIWRGFRIALLTKNKFGAFLAAGIITTLTLQVIVNIGVASQLLPVTGITLPFISSGGSSLIILMANMGIVLNISKYIED